LQAKQSHRIIKKIAERKRREKETEIEHKQRIEQQEAEKQEKKELGDAEANMRDAKTKA
jgi:hypothetical protein